MKSLSCLLSHVFGTNDISFYSFIQVFEIYSEKIDLHILWGREGGGGGRDSVGHACFELLIRPYI